MTTSQLIANYTPAVDIVSFIICCVLVYVIEKAMFYSNDRKFVFMKRALCFILFGSAHNVFLYSIASNWENAVAPIFIFRILNHVSFFLALYVFLLYMKKMVDVKRTIEMVVTYVTRALFCVCLVMDVLSPVTKIGFYREDGLWYDSIFSPYNLFYVYAFIILFLMLLVYSERLIRFVRMCFGVTGIVIAAIMFCQGTNNINTYTSFTYVLPILVVMILLHSKPFDDKTGALNSECFDNYLAQKVKEKVSLDYIVLKLNLSMMDGLPSELGKVLNSFWHGTFKDAMSFNLSYGVYVLAVPRVRKNGDTSAKIENLVNSEFTEYYAQYKVPYKLIVLSDLDFIESDIDMLGIITYLCSTMEENSALMIDDKKREELRTMKRIKENLADIEKQNNPEDPRVIVYCQPIRNMKTGKYDTAEALMRLSLDGIGMVPPYMFVTMAEEYGYIHTLTKIITNKVSKKVKELEEAGYKFLRISVNVAAADINLEGFCDELVEIIKNNGVNPAKIGVELTESRTDSDFMILKQKVKKLHDAGMTLYLDDVGTGYSNLDRIVQYDVDVVKFDRFFLLEAEKSMKVVQMMSHLSQAFKDLDYKLLFEGVETEAHEALCLTCGAEYIQGFKYSKPVPIDEMRNFFETADTELIAEPSGDKKKSNVDLFGRIFSYSEMKDHYSVLLSMAKLFYSMHVIDLVNNTAKPYNPTDDMRVVDVVNSTIGADKMMSQIMRMCTVDKDVDSVLEFSDLTTIADRMKGKKALQSDKYVGKSIGWYVATFFTIETDDEERPTKVVFTTRAVEEDEKV